jgi:hypothetical protein
MIRRNRQRQAEANALMVQENIKTKLNIGLDGSTSITDCAFPYSDTLQLSKKVGIFNIFGNDKIIQCNNKQKPVFVTAKSNEIPDGFTINNPSDADSDGLVKFGDKVNLCGSEYEIIGETENSKVNYGDKATLVNTNPTTSSQIKATHGICLDASQRSKMGGKVHMWGCNKNNKNQQWSYDPSTKQIKSTHGICLDASQRDKRGGKVHMWGCNKNNKNQQWSYDQSTKQIKAIHGKCLDATQRNKRGGKVHMWDCDTTNKNQQWDLNSSDKLAVTINPNVYGISNVKNLESSDFSNEYVKKYSYCGNSGNK